MKTKLPLTKAESLLKKNKVKFAGIFGSYAKGEQTDDSDIDILISFEESHSLFSIVHLERELSSLFGKEVDLVTEKSLSPYIKDEIINTVVIFYGKK